MALVMKAALAVNRDEEDLPPAAFQNPGKLFDLTPDAVVAASSSAGRDPLEHSRTYATVS